MTRVTLYEYAGFDEEGEAVLYSLDDTYYDADVGDEASDPGRSTDLLDSRLIPEKIDNIPAGSPSFNADGETYYYVGYDFYVEYEENDGTAYVSRAPDIGARVGSLPIEAALLEEAGVTYYRFDSIYFQEIQGASGSTTYEVVESPFENDEPLPD